MTKEFDTIKSIIIKHDEKVSHKFAVITHYMHNLGLDISEYYKDEAVEYMNDKEMKDFLKYINWDIPFPAAEKPKFTFIDLFAGIGGMRLAFQNLRGKCVFSSEWDKYAKVTYARNFGEVPFGDITKIQEKDIPDHDVLLAGFPCQAFSIAGKRGGFEDTRGTLFFDVARIVKEKQPKAFLLENVKGLVNHDRGKTLNVILNTLREDLNYYVPEPKVLNAKDFGVPQNRERIFIVGFRKDLGIMNFEYPKPLNIKTCIRDIVEEKPVLSKFYLSTKYLETLIEHKNRHASKGNGFGYQILSEDEIANAIVVGGMGRERNLIIDRRINDYTPITNIKGEINREGIRRMTPREWARLQGFPDIFAIEVSDTQAYKQFGNSVAIPVVQSIGNEMIKLLSFGENDKITYHGNYYQLSGKTYYQIEDVSNMITGNKGEWSEIYTFLRLLADGKLYAADANLNRIEDVYYPIIKILRSQIDGNYEYLRNGEIKVVDGITNNIILRIPVESFIESADILLRKIKESKGTFSVPEVESFLRKINCTTIKANSSDKSDITLVVHDLNTGFNPTLGFSIKSKLGGASTLLNASRLTNFIYKIHGEMLTDEDINYINSINTKSKIRDRILAVEERGGRFEIADIESQIFKLNMQVIDSYLPIIISTLLLHYYKGDASDLSKLLSIVEEDNPCNYDLQYNHSFYEYKIKAFLTDIALGMTPSGVWKGYYDANGGYIVVKENGEIVCYHIYNKNEFQEYLLKNTKLETPSSNRHKFGELYREEGNTYMKLNLQIRFKD